MSKPWYRGSSAPIRRARVAPDPYRMRRLAGTIAGVAALLMAVASLPGQIQPSRRAMASAGPIAQEGVRPPNPVQRVLAADADEAVIVAAGDIACEGELSPSAVRCQQKATAQLAAEQRPDAVLPLGDNQYETGQLAAFRSGYDKSWGRFNAIAKPVPGNHEYGYSEDGGTANGGIGYAAYFGDKGHPNDPGCRAACANWYSWDIARWHMVALDSQCSDNGGCHPGTPQYEWLKADLAATRQKCVLAYWHIPVFASGKDHQLEMKPVFSLLEEHGADVVLNGHGHYYERFARMSAQGTPDPADGLAQFVVGTGGRNFFVVDGPRHVGSEALITDTFGVLRMSLHAASYEWSFLSIQGEVLDEGESQCR